MLLPIVAYCGYGKKQKLIKPGRWKEYVRMLPDSTSIVFRDTMYMSFQAKDSFSYHHRNGFIYEGVFGVSEDSILDFGTARYKIVASKPDLIVLTNDKGIFHFKVDSSPVAKAIVLEKPDTALPVTDIDVMIGRWTVYKRTADGPAQINPEDNIRSMYVTGASTDGKLGYVYSGNDPDNVPSWYIKEYGGAQSLVVDGKSLRNIVVLRCQDGELIVEEEGIKYYFKQFK